MTTTTVEVERVVTESEEVAICDECGREVDDSGGQFWSKSTDISANLHFCSDCLDTMSDDFEPEHVERADEWLHDGKYNGPNIASVEREVRFAHAASKGCGSVALVVLAVLVIVEWVGIAITVPTLTMCLLFFLFLLSITTWATSDALTAVEEANDDLDR